MMVDDHETEEPEDVEKTATTAKEDTDDVNNNENVLTGMMSMMVDDQETEELEDVEKTATTAKEGTDDDIHNENELTGVMSMMVDDQEIKGDISVKDQDQSKELIQNKIVTTDTVDDNDNQKRNSKSQTVEIDTGAGALPVMEEEDLRRQDHRFWTEDQDQSKESISNDLKTDFETWTDEEEKLLEHKYSENDEKAAVKDDQDDEESEAESKIFVGHEVKVGEDQGLTETNPADKISSIKVEAVLDYGGC